MEITLKGAVSSMYGSATALAKQLGWSGRKARDIVSGRQAPTAKDMEELAEALDIRDANSFALIFFQICPQSGQPVHKAHYHERRPT